MELFKGLKGKNRKTDFKKHSQIHISDISYNECDLNLYHKYTGNYTPVHSEMTQWHFAVGHALHGVFETEMKRLFKGFIITEAEVSYGFLRGRLDICLFMPDETRIIDAKTTNSFLFEKPPKKYMEIQSGIYAGIVALTGMVGKTQLPNSNPVTGYIAKINKGGLPRYFNWDMDMYPINIDGISLTEKMNDRAEKLVKAIKSKTPPEGCPQCCKGCDVKGYCKGTDGKSITI